jgi:hypothetical protein
MLSLPNVKTICELEISDAKTPMTIHTQGGFENASDFLLEDQEFSPIQLGVEEGESYVLDFMNYDYD